MLTSTSKNLFFILRKPHHVVIRTACYSRHWQSHSGNFCYLWIKVAHYCPHCFCKEEKKCLVGYDKVDRKVLFEISRNICMEWKWLCIIFFQERQRKMLEDYWEIFSLLQNVSYSQERHGDLFDQLEEFVCFVHGAKVKNINNVR